MSRRTRVALALGSGGARGYAHIGVIQVLEERGYEIVNIAGASMGALVGGLRAAGRLEPYTEWAVSLTQREVLRLMDPSLTAPGAIRAEKVLAKVGEILGGALIEDLPVPFTAVATDLLARREVWFQSGPLDVAIRASIALPTVITPVMVNGRLLADGALMNPIPIAPTVASQADVTVAVSVSGETSASRTPTQETGVERPVEEWLDRVRRGAARVLDRDLSRRVVKRLVRTAKNGAPAEPVEEGPLGALPPGLRLLDVVELSLDAMQSVVAGYRLAGYPPDLMISMPKSAANTLDFHRAVELIALGREAATRAIDADPTFPAPSTGGDV